VVLSQVDEIEDIRVPRFEVDAIEEGSDREWARRKRETYAKAPGRLLPP
jgi:hypothetical protein